MPRRNELLLLVFVTILHSVATSYGQVFTRIEGQELTDTIRNGVGVAWGDFNTDGRVDVFLANSGPQDNGLYLGTGSDVFTPVDTGIIVNDGGSSRAASTADCDNDGDLDLAVANGSYEDNYLYSNNGDGTFTKLVDGEFQSDGGWSPGISWGDYDNDGTVDLYVSNGGDLFAPGQLNALYRGTGNCEFTKIVGDPATTKAEISFSTEWADYDDDGDLDLFVANWGAADSLYENQGDGTFVEVDSGPVVAGSARSISGSWADYDNDGDLDLFVSDDSLAGDPDFLYRNDGGGVFASVTDTPVTRTGVSSRSGAWFDYDNDGDLDLFVARYFNQNNALYTNDGAGQFSEVVTGSIVSDAGHSIASATADYDDDGDLDLIVTNGPNEPAYLYRNDLSNGNHWLKVLLVGQQSNRAAIGARVRVTATIFGSTTTQMRTVAGQSSGDGQSSLELHFGLGDATLLDEVRVEWPSGAVDVLAGVAVDETLQVAEGGAEAVSLVCGGVSLCPGGTFGYHATALEGGAGDRVLTVTAREGTGIPSPRQLFQGLVSTGGVELVDEVRTPAFLPTSCPTSLVLDAQLEELSTGDLVSSDTCTVEFLEQRIP